MCLVWVVRHWYMLDIWIFTNSLLIDILMNLNGHIIRQWRRLIRLNLGWRFWMRLRSWLGWEMLVGFKMEMEMEMGMMGNKCKNKNQCKRISSNNRWNRYKSRNKLMTSNTCKWNNYNLTSNDNSRLKTSGILFLQTTSKSLLKKNQNGRRWLRITTLLKMYHRSIIHRIRQLQQIMLRSRCSRIFSFWMVVFLGIGKMDTKIMMVVWLVLLRSNCREMGWVRRLKGNKMTRRWRRKVRNNQSSLL